VTRAGAPLQCARSRREQSLGVGVIRSKRCYAETSSSKQKGVDSGKPAGGAGDAHEPARQRTGRDESPAGSREFVYLYIQTELCRKESLREWLATHTANRERLECIEIFKQVLMQFFGAVVELGRCGSVAAVQF